MTKPATQNGKEAHGSVFASMALILLGGHAIFAIAWVLLSLTFFATLHSAGGSLSKLYRPEPVTQIKRPQFSSDGSKIAVTACGPCKIGIFTIDTERMVYLTPPDNSMAFDAIFDTQSDTIAFVMAKEVGDGAYDYQLAVSQMDGSGLKVLTSSDTEKRFPAYSFDGKKILFEGKQRCSASSTKFCFADVYEFDFQSNKERRVSKLQALQVGPAYFLPGNTEIVTPIFGSLRPDGLAEVPFESEYGKNRGLFIVDASNPNKYEKLALATATASSPKPLSNGDIAFLSRVNKYENKPERFVYDVLLWSNGFSRRLTHSNQFVSDYAISASAQSVLLVSEAKGKPVKCELILWNVAERTSRKYGCESPSQERQLVP